MNNNKQDEKIANMTFASVYPRYINKVEKKAALKQNFMKLLNGFVLLMKKNSLNSLNRR
jgi:hypothetical protein